MITVDDKMNITMSYGDTFLVTFNLSGYVLQLTDSIVFSVKERIDSTEVLIEKLVTNVTGTSVTVEIDSETFLTAVGKGNKVYDLLLSYGDENPETQKKSTLNFPAKLIIKDVAHNV